MVAAVWGVCVVVGEEALATGGDVGTAEVVRVDVCTGGSTVLRVEGGDEGVSGVEVEGGGGSGEFVGWGEVGGRLGRGDFLDTSTGGIVAVGGGTSVGGEARETVVVGVAVGG